jgi:hypothetical protein
MVKNTSVVQLGAQEPEFRYAKRAWDSCQITEQDVGRVANRPASCWQLNGGGCQSQAQQLRAICIQVHTLGHAADPPARCTKQGPYWRCRDTVAAHTGPFVQKSHTHEGKQLSCILPLLERKALLSRVASSLTLGVEWEGPC